MPPKTQTIDFENEVELCGNLPREEYLCPSEVGSTITQVVLRETRGQYECEFCDALFARQGVSEPAGMSCKRVCNRQL